MIHTVARVVNAQLVLLWFLVSRLPLNWLLGAAGCFAISHPHKLTGYKGGSRTEKLSKFIFIPACSTGSRSDISCRLCPGLLVALQSNKQKHG